MHKSINSCARTLNKISTVSCLLRVWIISISVVACSDNIVTEEVDVLIQHTTAQFTCEQRSEQKLPFRRFSGSEELCCFLDEPVKPNIHRLRVLLLLRCSTSQIFCLKL